MADAAVAPSASTPPASGGGGGGAGGGAGAGEGAGGKQDPQPYYFDDHNVLRHFQTDITVDTESVLKGNLGPQVLEFIFSEVQTRMVQMGMVRTAVPADAAEGAPTCDVFCSDGWLEADRLLVLCNNKRRAHPGIWSRGLCISDGLNVGSMLPYIRTALDASFGVIVLNSNVNDKEVPVEGEDEGVTAAAAAGGAEGGAGGTGGQGAAEGADGSTEGSAAAAAAAAAPPPPPVRTRKVKIAGSATPEEHILTVWDSIVKPSKARNVSFVAFDEGAELVKHLLRERPQDTFAQSADGAAVSPGAAGRVNAVVLVEPFVPRSVAAPLSPALQKFLDTRSIAIERQQQDGPGADGGGGDDDESEASFVMPRWEYLVHNTGDNALQFTLQPPDSAASRASGAGGGTASNLAITLSDTRDSAVSFLVRACIDNGATLAPSFLNAEATKHHTTACSVTTGGVKKKRSFRKVLTAGFNALRRKASGSFEPKAGMAASAGRGSALSVTDASSAGGQEHVHLDDFELLQVVGKGAFGKVFLVQRKARPGRAVPTKTVFAMKVLLKSHIFHKKQVEHTKTERHILEGIDHPYLVRLRFAFQTSKKLYMIMDYYAGGSLFYHLRKARRFTFVQAAFYGAELFLAMHHLHSLDIAYRDVKLENILMDKDGHVHLTDFGLSKEGVHDATAGAETFCGTAEYVAPELLQHKAYGKAADWWSFGILLYEMIVGRTPFYSKNRQQMFQAVMHSDPSFPEGFPSDAAALVMRLLTKDPDERLGSSDDDGWHEFREHPFFGNIDWERLEKKQMEPPYQPTIHSETDTSYVHKAFLREEPIDSTPGGGEDYREEHPEYEQERHFDEFDYVDQGSGTA